MKTRFNLTAVGYTIRVTREQLINTFRTATVLTVFTALSIFKVNAQPPLPSYPSLTFNSPVLISGTDLQVNAVYKFPNVVAGIDAHVTIMGMSGGAWLAEIDNTTGAGYYDAFQPYVGAAANDTSYIDWKFVFKKSGTYTDTILSTLAVTGVDVDGDASALKEFIQAATPGSFALDGETYLNFSFDGVRSTATSTIANYPLIDTNNRRSMFQMNFTNINTILYRNGAITTGGSQVRQTSIYFKSFFNYMTLLPVKLLSFDAMQTNAGTVISWTATGEDQLKQYIVQRSADGVTWQNISAIAPATAGSVNNYSVTDAEQTFATTYYRLQQSAQSGSSSYSKIVKLSPKNNLKATGKVFINGSEVRLTIETKERGEYIAEIYATNGTKLSQTKHTFHQGNNNSTTNLPQSIRKGIYVVVIKDKSGHPIYNQKIPVL